MVVYLFASEPNHAIRPGQHNYSGKVVDLRRSRVPLQQPTKGSVPHFLLIYLFFKQSTKVDCGGRNWINHAVDILRSPADGSYIVALTICICPEFSRSVRA
jgi:hypothetical protein